MARSDWGGRTVGHPPRKWLNLRGRGCPSRAESHSRRHPRESRWSSIGWSPMIFLRPAPAAKTRPVAASCVASSHAASGASTPRWEYHQELGRLPISVLAGEGSGVVQPNCGYLRLCMPRWLHDLGQQSALPSMEVAPSHPNATSASTKASTRDWHRVVFLSMYRSPPTSVRLANPSMLVRASL
jgi:hypothetical protein